MNKLSENKQNILIVDDDTDIRFALKRIVGRCGHHANEVGSGSEALSAMSDHDFDMVFCDLRFRVGESGEQLLQTMRSDFPDVKIIMMSCAMDYSVRQDLLNKGAAECIQKPFFREQCADIIDRVAIKVPLKKAA